VVKLLLGGEAINLDYPDRGHHRPVAWAAIQEHKGVVKLLLEQGDVDLKRTDKNRLILFEWATLEGWMRRRCQVIVAEGRRRPQSRR